MNPVEGEITVNGSPLAKGNVVLWPDASRGNKSSINPSGEVVNGRFKVMTQGSTGAPRGVYKVTVSSADIPDSTRPTEYKNPIPEAYREEKKTPLTLEVPSSSYSLKVTASE